MALWFGYFFLEPVYLKSVDVYRLKIVGQFITGNMKKFDKLEPRGQAIVRAAIMAGFLGHGSKKGQAKFWKPVCKGLIEKKR